MMMQAMPGITWHQAAWEIPLVTGLWHVLRWLESRGAEPFLGRHEPDEWRQKVALLKWMHKQPDIMEKVEAVQAQLRRKQAKTARP